VASAFRGGKYIHTDEPEATGSESRPSAELVSEGAE
jgi:hypothetical protein